MTRAIEGSYWLIASNAWGQATSAPIAAVVSNVDPQRFMAFRWSVGEVSGGLSLDSTDRLGPGATWTTLSNYPPMATKQQYVELQPLATRFYRLSGLGFQVPFTKNGLMNGWQYTASVGTQHRIEYMSAPTGWTNWLTLTNLVLPASPYLFIDQDSMGAPARVYRTTPIP